MFFSTLTYTFNILCFVLEYIMLRLKYLLYRFFNILVLPELTSCSLISDNYSMTVKLHVSTIQWDISPCLLLWQTWSSCPLFVHNLTIYSDKLRPANYRQMCGFCMRNVIGCLQNQENCSQEIRFCPSACCKSMNTILTML